MEELKKYYWEYVNDKIRHLEIENKLHRRYFVQFDALLEKMADRYLKLQEEGREKRVLDSILKDIQVMENFREYVAILQTWSQIHAEEAYKMACTINKLNKRHKYVVALFKESMHLKTLILTGQNKEQTPK